MNIIAIRSLKIPSDSILEGVIFKNFLEGHTPRPPYSLHASHAHVLCTLCEC